MHRSPSTPTKAPCTVNSFVSLASRTTSTTPTATGSPRSRPAASRCSSAATRPATGTGGPGYTFADEVDGAETYRPGVLAMANRGPDTNGSQFFIVYDDSPLDPDYTVFGTVDDATVQPISDLAAQGTVEPTTA